MSSSAPAAPGAIILAGGGGTRIGGADKAAIEVAGATLLDRAVRAGAAAGVRRPVIVVGPARELAEADLVRFAREEPPSGGPVAALYAGLDALRAATAGLSPPTHVLVWAVDMPGVDAEVLRALAAQTRPAQTRTGGHGSVLCAPDGRRQLAFHLDLAVLESIRPAEPAGMALHRLLRGLELTAWQATAGQSADIDTEADLRLARRRHGEGV